MPQGKGTYGSQVGRPSKKRTSYVNDNNWWDKLKQGVSDLRPYNPQSVVQAMEYREGKSMLTTKPKKAKDDAYIRRSGEEYKSAKFPIEDHYKKARETGTRRFNKAGGIPGKAWDYGRKDTLRRGERVGSLANELRRDK